MQEFFVQCTNRKKIFMNTLGPLDFVHTRQYAVTALDSQIEQMTE